ncbi:MAG: hypothetical protein KDC70_17970, partial [Saprospiraceae bacterium]|nr:hypothetical protein [Saprospiraceae bacterium]
VKDMLGDELFLKGLHHYIRTWNGKHPIPYDFFNCMNAGTGVDLNWFWKRWFFDDGVPDLAISNVTEQVGRKKILVESKGEKPVPVDLAIKFDDGSTEHIHYSVEIWKRGNRTLEIEMQTEKNIEEILLGGPHTPDIDKSNNVYRKK